MRSTLQRLTFSHPTNMVFVAIVGGAVYVVIDGIIFRLVLEPLSWPDQVLSFIEVFYLFLLPLALIAGAVFLLGRKWLSALCYFSAACIVGASIFLLRALHGDRFAFPARAESSRLRQLKQGKRAKRLKAESNCWGCLTVRRCAIPFVRAMAVVALAGIRLSAGAAIFCLLVLAKGASADDAFIPQCPKMLVEAESFAHDCLSNARKLSRVFYPGGHGVGEPETYSTYFKDAPAGSHFALGCTLNWQHKINFLGIYYSTDGNNFSKANAAPIRFIDAQGNVGVMIDGAPVTLLAVRQFGSEWIPLRYPGSTPKNCESARLPNGYLADSEAEFSVEGDLSIRNPTLKVCIVGACRSYQFMQFFMDGESQIVHHELSLRVLFGSAGNILVEDKYYDDSCGKWYRNLAYTEDIVHELCRMESK
jgi:hypothetical protein